MTALRTQVTLNPDDETRDHIMNTWWCSPVGATSEEDAASAFVAALNTFYQAIDAQLSTELNGLVPLVRVFDLADPKPRQPIYETVLTALVTNGTNVGARESACCVSFRGTYVSGQNPARRRGRIFIGPLRADAVNTSTGLLSATPVSAFATAADALITTSNASTEFAWVIYSPTTDTAGNGSQGVYNVISGWVDNNPDYQRRRQSGTRAKTLFS